MSDVVIAVEALVKTYRKSKANAVDGVSFDVRQGDFFALLGPNGAGKTTTISILTTTLLPSAGQVRIAGHNVVDASDEVRRRIGIIFQHPSLDVNLTGEQNVRLHAIMYGLYPYRPTYRSMPAAYRSSVDGLASLLGIGAEIMKPVRTMSGGMKRKFEILRSLLHRPEILFLDEPTAGLDPTSRRDLWRYLRNVQAESGTTVFLTTHYLEEAENADQVCVIAKGHVVANGSPAELRRGLVGRSILLLDSPDRAGLRADLDRLGASYAENAAFELAADASDAQRIIAAIGVPLSVMRTHEPTLEDAYLEIVGSSQDEETVDV